MAGTIDSKRMIAEVVARHGIKIDVKDPMMAVMTMNELAMAQLIDPVIERIEAVGPAFEQAILRVHRLAGEALSQDVRKAAAILRAEIQTDVKNARLNASQLVTELNEAHKRGALLRLAAITMTCAVIIFFLGFWVGWKL